MISLRYTFCLMSFTYMIFFTNLLNAADLPTGTIEFITDSSYSRTNVSFEDEDLFSLRNQELALGFGYCFTSLLELRGNVLFNKSSYLPADSDTEPSVSSTSTGLGGEIIFNFPTTAMLVPFIEGGFGILNYSGEGFEDAETSIIFPSLGAGVRFLIGDSSSINLGIGYSEISNWGGVKDLTNNELQLGLGMSILIK